MIFNGPVTAAHARRVAMACIIIIFGCSRSRSTTFPSAADRPVVRSNAGHAAIPLLKWPLWEFISDDGSAVLHAPVYGGHMATGAVSYRYRPQRNGRGNTTPGE